ncbi:MAG: 4Fe-4S binding protein, partial [Eubacteriaceae bacterium]|nr:4Fe-4S binding protein [Eubacteriaceae bacterium]
YEYVKEVFGDSVCVLKIGMVNPLPDAMIRQFASEVDKLVVIEELDPIIEEHCKVLGLDCHGKDMFPIIGEFFQSTVREAFGLPMPQFVEDPVLPARPPVMCAGCPHRGLFYVLAKNRFTVFGDIGCYTLGSSAPLNAVDTVLCMGESLGGIHGFNKIRGEESQSKTVSVIGDSTFMHSGMTGLANIAYNASNSTVIIADNSTTGMTGHQNNPTNGFNIKGEPANKIDLVALVKAMGIDHVRIVDPYDLKETEKAVLEEAAFDGPSVIISRRPCALLKSTKLNPPLKVDEDKCQKCKQCMKIGCPAISMDTDHAVIDATQCVGCGVCSQMCKFDAIGGGEA